jgi:hypothetical protein
MSDQTRRSLPECDSTSSGGWKLLDDWLTEHRGLVSAKELADRVGVTEPAISDLRHKRTYESGIPSRPGLARALLIEAATSVAGNRIVPCVPAETWLSPSDSQRLMDLRRARDEVLWAGKQDERRAIQKYIAQIGRSVRHGGSSERRRALAKIQTLEGVLDRLYARDLLDEVVPCPPQAWEPPPEPDGPPLTGHAVKVEWPEDT